MLRHHIHLICLHMLPILPLSLLLKHVVSSRLILWLYATCTCSAHTSLFGYYRIALVYAAHYRLVAVFYLDATYWW